MRVYILEKKVKGSDNVFICTTKFKTILNETKKMIIDGKKFFLYELKIQENKSLSFSRLKETFESGELEFGPIYYGAIEDFRDPEFHLELNEKTKRVLKKDFSSEIEAGNLTFKVKLKNRLMIFPEGVN